MSAGAVVHAAILALVNLGSIVIGFLVFALARGGGQLAVQAPVAIVLTVPLHYVTQGYPTAFSNLTALWSFQVFANLIAVTVGVQFRQGEA